MVSIQRSLLSLGIALAVAFLQPFASLFLSDSDNSAAQARSRSSRIKASSRSTGTRASRSRQHSVGSRHGGSGSRKHVHLSRKSVSAAKPKYAYPLDFFMMHAPDFDRAPMEEALASKVKDAFERGIADDVSPEKMVKAGVFIHYPLSGGIFKRREDVKYIVLHSTETGVPVPAKNVINGWNSMGRRHPGAQYVVDRDGVIYQALDPQYASVHVNIFKTLPGINNDNTIGIEMNHTGRQNYPQAQREAVTRLLAYLQQRFQVTSDNVITHRYAQQGDHTDPVNFDLEPFLAQKESFRTRAIALKRSMAPLPFSDEETEDDVPLASVYVQIHGPLPEIEARLPQQSNTGLRRPWPASDASAADNAIAMPKGTFVAGTGISREAMQK